MSKLPVRDRLQGLSLFFILAFIAPVLSAQEEASTFAGSEACGTCHEEILQSFQKNRHAALDSDEAKQWAGKVCESCHGPGGKHAREILHMIADHTDRLSTDARKEYDTLRRSLGDG